jgi:hypothetical protein
MMIVFVADRRSEVVVEPLLLVGSQYRANLIVSLHDQLLVLARKVLM